MAEPRPRLMTIAAVAEQLGCHVDTIRRAIRGRTLACYQVGRCIRISPEQVAAYLESNLCPARGPADPSCDGTATAGMSSGGIEDRVAALRRARRVRSALDNSSRISKPALSVIRSD